MRIYAHMRTQAKTEEFRSEFGMIRGFLCAMACQGIVAIVILAIWRVI